MAKDWDSGTCNEKSGFLFSHSCDRPPVRNCDKCERPVCADHSHGSSSHGIVCTTCAKKSLQGKNRASSRGFARNDPYFYGGYHYGGRYGTGYHESSMDDYNDFTEADAENLTTEGDEGFENDMSES